MNLFGNGPDPAGYIWRQLAAPTELIYISNSSCEYQRVSFECSAHLPAKYIDRSRGNVCAFEMDFQKRACVLKCGR